jgi:methionine transaminase
MMNAPSRLPEIGSSIFAVMTKMALEHGAINLSQGFPDFSIDEKLINLVHRFMLEGHNQYAPMPGLPALREILSEVVFRTYEYRYDPETQITITSGATEGLYAAITAFVRPGDEVIIFDPSYDSYDPAIRLNGGIAVRINLKFPDFTIDWQKVKSRVSNKTRMIIINNPQNPTGTTLTENDLVQLEKLAVENNLIVLSDEVYDRLVYDGLAHLSVLRYPDLAARSLAVFSFGKTFHATGWKCGYVVGSELLTRELRKTHQFIVFSVNTPVQWALAEYLKDPAHYQHLGNFYQQKRDRFLSAMKGSSFRPLPCRGSYFQVMSYDSISNKLDTEMASELTQKFKVAAIPLSVFYADKTDNRLLRFCFAKKDETLEKATEILRRI